MTFQKSWPTDGSVHLLIDGRLANKARFRYSSIKEDNVHFYILHRHEHEHPWIDASKQVIIYQERFTVLTFVFWCTSRVFFFFLNKKMCNRILLSLKLYILLLFKKTKNKKKNTRESMIFKPLSHSRAEWFKYQTALKYYKCFGPHSLTECTSWNTLCGL